MTKSQSRLVQSHIVEPSNSARSEDEEMNITHWEYAADLVRFAMDHKAVVGGTAVGVNAFALAIKRGLEYWLWDEDSDEDNIAANRSIASIVGEKNASEVVDLMRSDLEALTGGEIGSSSIEVDGHHTPDQLAKRWFDRWHG